MMEIDEVITDETCSVTIGSLFNTHTWKGLTLLPLDWCGVLDFWGPVYGQMYLYY